MLSNSGLKRGIRLKFPQIGLAVLLAFSGISALIYTAPHSEAMERVSRLNSLIVQKPTLYMPPRLLIGQDNKFILKGKAGNKAMLYLSPSSSGMRAPNGLDLRIGEEHQKISGIFPENGVLVLTVPVPKESSLIGKTLYLEAITWSQPDYSDLEVLSITDFTGRRTSENALAIDKPADGKGSPIMPALPGVPTQLLNRLNTFNDLRQKPELNDQGAINRNVPLDQNSFYNPYGTNGP